MEAPGPGWTTACSGKLECLSANFRRYLFKCLFMSAITCVLRIWFRKILLTPLIVQGDDARPRLEQRTAGARAGHVTGAGAALPSQEEPLQGERQGEARLQVGHHRGPQPAQ